MSDTYHKSYVRILMLFDIFLHPSRSPASPTWAQQRQSKADSSIIYTFSGAVTYSQNKMSIQPLHVRRLLYFLHTWPTWLHTALS
jgi:hypothetical protein